MAAEKRSCRQCGAENELHERTCHACGASLAPAPPPPLTPPPSPGAVVLPPPPPPVPAVPVATPTSGFDRMIPQRNPSALGAYYVGLFSFIPLLGLPLGILAVVMGVKGLKAYRAMPEIHGKTHAWFGLICGGFWALVYAFLTVALIVSLATGR